MKVHSCLNFSSVDESNYVGHGPIRHFGHNNKFLNIQNYEPKMNGKFQYFWILRPFYNIDFFDSTTRLRVLLHKIATKVYDWRSNYVPSWTFYLIRIGPNEAIQIQNKVNSPLGFSVFNLRLHCYRIYIARKNRSTTLNQCNGWICNLFYL